MTVIFACRRNRLGDIGLIRRGVVSAGHDLHVLILPWATPLLLFGAMMRLFGKRIYLIISDKQIGDSLIGRLFGRDCTRMMWNYADEWPASGIQFPRHKVCFFREAGFDVDEFQFAPQPESPQIEHHNGTPSSIMFVGDVTVEFTLPRGGAWWRSKFEELRDAFGYAFYLRAEYEALVAGQLPLPEDRRIARVLAKNLLRLWVVQSVHDHFGARLILVGSNWRLFGMRSNLSQYNAATRLQLYRSATVNLDCGSKSGSGAIYPRSSELISYSGGLLQVCCADTAAIFGERAPEFSFDNGSQVIERIEARLSEPLGRRAERDAWLVGGLRNRKLLMQHSIDRMIHHSDRLC
jgi:hypothetical protein